MNDSSVSRIFFYDALLFDRHSRRRNKSSVTASMFRDGECTLLFLVPRRDEHYRRSKQCGIDAVHFDREIRVRRILLCAIVFFSQPFAWSKARSDLCARYPFPDACFGLLEQAKYPFLLKLAEKNRFANLNVLINPENSSTRFGQKSWSPVYKISKCI